MYGVGGDGVRVNASSPMRTFFWNLSVQGPWSIYPATFSGALQEVGEPSGMVEEPGSLAGLLV